MVLLVFCPALLAQEQVLKVSFRTQFLEEMVVFGVLMLRPWRFTQDCESILLKIIF